MPADLSQTALALAWPIAFPWGAGGRRSVEFFSNDYQSARSAFVAAAQATGARRLASYPHPLVGPAAETLATDVAMFGEIGSRRLVVVVSGTHGVEGFAGSAVQTGLLRKGTASALGGDTALLLVHALNPWGFAYCRRSDHENIDCNRNFVDFNLPLPPNPGYARLHDHLIPTAWNASGLQVSAVAISDYISDFGQAAFLQAVSAGQYDFPEGLFFGGRTPSWSRRTWAKLVAEHMQGFDEIVLVDLHTGLGPPAIGEAMYLGPRGRGAELARRMFGEITELEGGGSVSVEVAGHLGGALVAAVPKTLCTPIALEFGTRPVMEVLRALQFDAWANSRAQTDERAKARAALTMLRAFYSFSPRWRSAVWRRANAVVQQAISYSEC